MPVTKEKLAVIRQHESYIEQIAADMAKDEPHGKLYAEYPGAPYVIHIENKPGKPPTIKKVAVTYLGEAKP